MILLRENCIGVRSAAKRLPRTFKPTENDLYKFFDGHKDRLTDEQKRRMANIITDDAAEMVTYLMDGVPKAKNGKK